jgi:hypothetical protein
MPDFHFSCADRLAWGLALTPDLHKVRFGMEINKTRKQVEKFFIK